jgi:outer membrane protein
MPTTTHRRPAAACLIALMALVALWPATAARAQVASAARIGVVDTEKILITSATGKAALAQLKALQEQKETELRGRQEEIKALQAQISDGRLSLAADKLAQLQKQLEEKTIALKRAGDDAQRELTAKRDEILAAIDQKVMPVINQFGKEQGYTLIFRKFESGLIYADEATDITAEMIRRVDAAQ